MFGLAHLADNKHFLMAYSGGLDSHALLHKMSVLKKQNPEIQLRAIHVHHGLHEKADQWAAHCEIICRQLDIPLSVKKINIPNHTGESLEALAREARYRVIAEHLAEDECVLTAHTMDDQAETLLLQLIRGAGPKGLSAMPMRKPFAHSVLLRPLLKTTRETLEQYAAAQALVWVEDESNQDHQFDRNYLRHRVMPLLKARWPAVLNTLSRSAQHCANASNLLTEFADRDLMQLQGSAENTLSVSSLLQLSSDRRSSIFRHWLKSFGLNFPSTQQVQQFEKNMLQCDEDAMPMMIFDTMQMRRYRDDIYLLPLFEAFDERTVLSWDLKAPLKLPGNFGELQPAADYHVFNDISLRFRQGGEKIKPAGSDYTQSLKKLFQAWGVPPWERDRIPLLYSGDRLIEVIGYCRSF
jgi:tRNA(Ile)-lysidine synthase